MLIVLGYSTLSAVVGIFDVGWSVWQLGKHPTDLLAALLAMAGGVLLCHHCLGW